MSAPDVKSRLKSSYDAIAPAYNDWAVRDGALRLRFLNRLLDLLRPSTPGPAPDSESTSAPAGVFTALELGCGAGVPVTQTLLSSPGGRTFHVTANDLSSSQIALGKQALGEDDARVRWVQGDMMSLEFSSGSFDVVIALYSVIHLPRDEQVVLLGRIAQWLKPGGLALINFGAEEAEREVMEDWMGGWMFWSAWGAEVTLQKVREEAGLEVVVDEVTPDDGVDASFLWVIARASGKVGG